MVLPSTLSCRQRSLLPVAARALGVSAKANYARQKVTPVPMSYASYDTSISHGSERVPPPLVVMHGLFGSKGNWNSLCKAFHQKTSPQRKVLAVDARNHGDSPHSPEHSYAHLAEDIIAFLKSQQIKQATLLGHSMGGRATMYCALKYPEYVSRLIVGDISPISTSPNLNAMPKLTNTLKNIKLPVNIPMSTARLNVDLQMSKSIDDKGLRAFLLTNLVKGTENYRWRVNLDAVAKNFYDHIAVFPREMLNQQFEGPVLFVGGGASDFLQKNDHKEILKMFPNAKFHYIEGAGHWLHSEKPAEFLQVCLDFLNDRTMN